MYVYLFIQVYTHQVHDFSFKYLLYYNLCLRVETLNDIDKKGKKKYMKNLVSTHLNFINSKLLFIVQEKNVDYYYECYIMNLIVETLWLTTIFFLKKLKVMKLFY